LAGNKSNKKIDEFGAKILSWEIPEDENKDNPVSLSKNFMIAVLTIGNRSGKYALSLKQDEEKIHYRSLQ
jgi:hypothetical protein